MRRKFPSLMLFITALYTVNFTGSVLRAATPPADDSTRKGNTEVTVFAGISAPVNKEAFRLAGHKLPVGYKMLVRGVV